MKADKKKERRFRSKNFLITISDLEKEEISDLEKLRDKCLRNDPSATSITVRRELHSTGKYHLHVLFTFSGRKEYRRSHFDYICNKRANVSKDKPYSSLSAAIKYVTKSKDYLSTDEDLLAKVNLSLSDIFSLESREEVIAKLRREEKYLPRLSNILHNYEVFRENEKVLKERTKKFFPLVDIELFKELLLKNQSYLAFGDLKEDALNVYLRILRELNHSSRRPLMRPFKSRNLYIQGASNTGKSSFLKLLEENRPTYRFPRDKWFSSYHNKVYQIILWDEITFRGLPIEDLNLIFEGSPTYLEIKGSKLMKSDNPLIIMVSNNSLRSHFQNRHHYISPASLEALKNRITQVIIPDGVTLFPLIEIINIIIS